MHGIGGMQEHTVNLARGLTDSGHEVEVITARHPNGLSREAGDGITWHFVDARATSPRFPMRHPRFHRLSAERFLEIHRQRRFDVVHSESTSALGLLHLDLHKTVPIVAKFHGNYIGHAREMVARARDGGALVRETKGLMWLTARHFLSRGNWYMFRGCEAMVPSLSQLEDTRRSHLLDRARLHVVPNGIDARLFTPGSQADARSALRVGDALLFVCVGRLNREKGVRHALTALASLSDAARLCVVGDGEERGALEAHARRLGVADRVTFVGAVPSRRVAAFLQAADAFVFPTEHPEAAPLVLLQAMGCGLPTVASDVGAIPEITGRKEDCALLVPPGRADALARAMHRLAEDAQLRSAMGRRARERVMTEFTLERMVERTLDVYEIAGAKLRVHRAPTTMQRRCA